MIHVLSDDPDGADQLGVLKNTLGDPEMQQLNTTVFDGQRVTFDELVGACDSMPFLAERRLVVVRRLLARFSEKSGAQGKRRAEDGGEERKEPELARQLRDYLPRLPATVELVFFEGAAIGKQHPLHKALVAAKARFAQTPAVQGEALAAWIERRVAAKGGRLARSAARLLASYGGDNLRLLDHELDKLVAYAGSAEIDARGINQLVGAANESNVYKMGDAIAEGNAGAGLQQLHALLESGEHPLYVLTMIVRHFRLLIQIKDLHVRGMRQEEIAPRLHLAPFVVERLSRQLRRYPTFEQLEYIYRRLLECDEAMKTGRSDLVVSIELLISELARTR